MNAMSITAKMYYLVFWNIFSNLLLIYSKRSWENYYKELLFYKQKNIICMYFFHKRIMCRDPLNV